MKKLLFLSCLFGLNAFAEVKTITDVLGREVKIDVPVKRAILTFYYPDFIAVAGAEKFEKNVVGISREFWEKYNVGSWNLYTAAMPALKNIADVGYPTNKNFSTEKVLSLKPDVLIAPKIQFDLLKDELPKFEKLDVPVVFVDFNDQTVENHVKSALIFGALSGEEERAQAIANEYSNGIKELQDKIAKANLPKPKIYIEFGNKDAGEYSYTFGKNMWGAIANTVSGDNIAAPFIETWGQINPEQFLTNPPEVIIISGTESNADTNPDIMAMGINISEADALRRLHTFKTRAGWDNVPAIKNKRFYGLYHTMSRSLSDLAASQFIAKVLYPEIFTDLDPAKTYFEFHQKYLPIKPEGTFFLSDK